MSTKHNAAAGPLPVPPPGDRPIDRLVQVMAALRDPAAGCPWDLEQSFQTIAPYTIEEAYEVADAIREGDMAQLRDELGDLLLQAVYHARLAEEAGHFAFDDVAAGIAEKMIRRHPHVFGDQVIDSAGAQTVNWEQQKAAERRARAAAEGCRERVLDGVSLALPGLTRAAKLQRRAARVGFDWPEAAQVLDKMEEEIAELRAELAASPRDPARLEDEVGDLLFVCANLARHLDVDPEAAIRACNAKFERRFRRVEEMVYEETGGSPADQPLDALEARWQRAKLEEREKKPA